MPHVAFRKIIELSEGGRGKELQRKKKSLAGFKSMLIAIENPLNGVKSSEGNNEASNNDFLFDHFVEDAEESRAEHRRVRKHIIRAIFQ